jgi:hypothetical protein
MMLMRRLIGSRGSCRLDSTEEDSPTTRAVLSVERPAASSARRAALARSAERSHWCARCRSALGAAGAAWTSKTYAYSAVPNSRGTEPPKLKAPVGHQCPRCCAATSRRHGYRIRSPQRWGHSCCSVQPGCAGRDDYFCHERTVVKARCSIGCADLHACGSNRRGRRCEESLPYAEPPTYADSTLVAQAYVKAAPERVVWGSDWPHPNLGPNEKPTTRCYLICSMNGRPRASIALEF